MQKRTARSTKATGTRTRRADPTNAARVLDDASDKSSSVGSVDDFEEDEADLLSFELPAPQRAPTDSQPGLFTDAQMAAIQDTVRLSLEQAMNSRSCPSTEPFSSPPPPITLTPSPQRQGAATPLGLHRPLDRNLEDKILRGDFAWLLSDSLSRPQVPEIQLRVDDSTPGSASPVSMVRKRKPVIDTFQKWLDACTAYMLVLVTSYPRRSLELLKYQQIISRAATKFKGLAFLAYDEQFRRTGPQSVLQVPIRSPTSAAVAGPLPTPSSTAQTASPGALNDTTSPPAPATAARNKVELLAKNYSPHVTTPIDVDVLERELDGHPNRNFVNTLIDLLRYGTHVGYTGPQKPRVSRNLISANQQPDVVTSNLWKEISLGCIAGPFSSSPLPNLQCHPVGVVPKKHSSEWRTIYHLSYPVRDSINDYIPKDPYALQYVRVDDAIHILKSLGPGSFTAKTDLKSAFRLIPVHPEDWHLLGIYWQQQYYVELYLPFGLRSAPFLFNQLSDVLEWVLKHNYGLQHVLHILDDFFIAEPSRFQCLSSFSKLLRFFMSVKAPVVTSKTLGPSQVLEFMGIELDSTCMEARLPVDKLRRAQDLLNSFAKRRSVRLVELQSLIGTLQFACKAVVPGRTFLQRMVNLTRGYPAASTKSG